jgi:hypothetical protein
VLRQAGETLPWISLRQDIDAGFDRLRRLVHDRRLPRAVARERYLEEAAALDKLLLDYALIVPIRDLERGRLPRHIAERQFDTAWPP